jgi:DNA-binding NtrC family response regulator
MNQELNKLAEAVMVISPQKTLRHSIEKLVEQAGFIICPGVDNLAGFHHALNAAETPPTVILVDYWLSRSLTIDFLQSLKRQQFAVILMGTHFLGKDVAAAERVGFIEKPFTKTDLTQAIATAKC